MTPILEFKETGKEAQHAGMAYLPRNDESTNKERLQLTIISRFIAIKLQRTYINGSTSTTTVFDIRVTDTHGPTQRSQNPAKVLQKQEDEKKAKYLYACCEYQLHFTPMVLFGRWHWEQRSNGNLILVRYYEESTGYYWYGQYDVPTLP